MTDLTAIVVGIDGSSASSAAIRFAAHEAKRLGSGIHLVHVVPNYEPVTPMFPLAPPDLVDTGREILAGAEEQAHALLAPGQVTTSLLNGPRVATLVEEAKQARLVVLGAERRPAIDRLLTGSTVYGVAAHAACSVIAVPPEWSADVEHPAIVIGVKSAEDSADVVRHAFDVASDRKADLVLLHAWELPNEYDDLIAARVHEDEWAERTRAAMEPIIHGLQETHPEVSVEVRVVHGQPARVLREASAEAELLLIARRSHGFPFGYIGGTGRALLREALCPVEVVPPAS